MQEAVPPGVGAMAALLKLPEGKLDGVLEQAAQGEVVSAANLNSPDQTVIAGHAGAVARAMELAKAAGARRAVLLPVSAPFHCALMKPAQERLRADLDATDFRDLSRPLVNNWQAREIRTGAEAREGLYQQVPNPVRWLESIRQSGGTGHRALRRGGGRRRAYRPAARYRRLARRAEVWRAAGPRHARRLRGGWPPIRPIKPELAVTGRPWFW